MRDSSGGSTRPPSADLTISAREYEFGVPANLKAGTSTVAFRNQGLELHVLIAALIDPGKTFEDMKQAFTSQDPNVRPPLDIDNASARRPPTPGARSSAS